MQRNCRIDLAGGGVLFLITTLVAITGSGCGGKKATERPAPTPAARPAPTPQPRPQTRPAAARRGSLYERLGGETAVRAVVDDFVARAAADPAVNFTREGRPTPWQPTPQNLARLKQRLVEFIATTAGGPMQYGGRDMVTAHRGMGITNAEFDALAGHLRAALDANDVPRRERDELLQAVSSTRGAIVEATDAPPAETPRTEDPAPTDPADPATADPAPADASPAPGEAAEPAEPTAPDQPDEPKPDAAPAETPAPEEPASEEPKL
jgi:hemoglobin